MVVVAAAAVVVGATTAFFSDTETSTGNTFTAGSIDLKVDSDCHYWNIVNWDGDEPIYEEVDCGTWVPENPEGSPVPVAVGDWEENDLGAIHRFFNFSDIKPGDKGEDTISLHVYDNDAWGRVLFTMLDNNDNTCTEPEEDAENGDCWDGQGNGDDEGELLSAMGGKFHMWLDQGSTPGFQNVYRDATGKYVKRPTGDPDFDRYEGDNVWQENYEPTVQLSETVDLRDVLRTAWSWGECNQGSNGHNNYGVCHGLAEDGRMVGSTTYYFGFEWELPWSTGNSVQTDSLGGDLGFEVVQHRNNPTPSWD